MAGRPYMAFFLYRLYNAYVEGNTPTIAKELGECVDAYNEDDGLPYKGNGINPFGRIIISDQPSHAALVPYLGEWKQNIDWTVTAQVGDAFTLAIHATNPGASGNGNLLLDQIAQVITDWNGSVDIVNTTANNIIVNITGLGAIGSYGFFGYQAVAAVKFTQPVAYDSVNNIYTIAADYSAIGAGASKVEELLHNKGCAILSNVNKVITFTVPRATVVTAFKSAIQEKAVRIRERRYSVNATTVANAQAAGGDLVMTFAQFQAALVDASV